MSTKAWYEANREKTAARNKAWYEANPEKVLAIKKAYREANPEKVLAASNAYREANPEKAAARQWRYDLGPDAPPELIEARTMWTLVRRELRK